MDQSLLKVLKPAYPRCPGFDGVCSPRMTFNPGKGHLPRGFRGATGSLEEVELVLVYAEPGDPGTNEVHTGMESVLKIAMTPVAGIKNSLFHANLQHILNLCWPNMEPARQMRRVWMTESVLCSAEKPTGYIPVGIVRECGERYLLRQLKLFPSALVVALGNKAQNRLRMIGYTNFLAVGSVAPPGGNYLSVKESWKAIPVALKKKRRR